MNLVAFLGEMLTFMLPLYKYNFWVDGYIHRYKFLILNILKSVENLLKHTKRTVFCILGILCLDQNRHAFSVENNFGIVHLAVLLLLIHDKTETISTIYDA